MKSSRRNVASDGKGMRWYGTAEWLSSAEGLKVAGSQSSVGDGRQESNFDLSEEVREALDFTKIPVCDGVNSEVVSQ